MLTDDPLRILAKGSLNINPLVELIVHPVWHVEVYALISILNDDNVKALKELAPVVQKV